MQLKRAVLTASLIVGFAIILVGCSATKGLNISNSDVNMIIIQSGTTGESVEVMDAAAIQHITDNYNSLKLQRAKKISTDGWAYSVTWYDKEGNALESIAYGINFNKNRAVTGLMKDGYNWTIKDGEVDNALIESLLP